MVPSSKLYVRKRDGRHEEVVFEKITKRIQRLCTGLDPKFVDAQQVTLKVIRGLYAGVSTVQLDILAAEIAASMTTLHPDYGTLAARITVANMHKETKSSFAETIHDLYRNGGTGRPLISDYHYRLVCHKYADTLDRAIVHDRDYDFDYFGIKTLEKSYLLRIADKIVERPQYLFMRVAIGIHGDDIDSVLETYDMMSRHIFIHATPTLFAAGTPENQLSSCYLLTIKGDSIDGIFKTVADCAAISKMAGGIGLNIHNIRARGSTIVSTNGKSNGIVPMLRVFNNVARYVDQGGGKRIGSFAIYLEPWHADIFEFLDLKKNHGIEEHRARDLFYGLWINDLFMRRVRDDSTWSLMCPKECPGLADVWGAEFDRLYIKYEEEGRARRTIQARTLWRAIIESQVETGTPYMLYKDACNRKSNQSHLGTIKCSNLCTEIIQYSAPDEIAVCNLASIALPKFVRTAEDEDDTDTFAAAYASSSSSTASTEHASSFEDVNVQEYLEERGLTRSQSDDDTIFRHSLEEALEDEELANGIGADGKDLDGWGDGGRLGDEVAVDTLDKSMSLRREDDTIYRNTLEEALEDEEDKPQRRENDTIHNYSFEQALEDEDLANGIGSDGKDMDGWGDGGRLEDGGRSEDVDEVAVDILDKPMLQRKLREKTKEFETFVQSVQEYLDVVDKMEKSKQKKKSKNVQFSIGNTRIQRRHSPLQKSPRHKPQSILAQTFQDQCLIASSEDVSGTSPVELAENEDMDHEVTEFNEHSYATTAPEDDHKHEYIEHSYAIPQKEDNDHSVKSEHEDNDDSINSLTYSVNSEHEDNELSVNSFTSHPVKSEHEDIDHSVNSQTSHSVNSLTSLHPEDGSWIDLEPKPRADYKYVSVADELRNYRLKTNPMTIPRAPKKAIVPTFDFHGLKEVVKIVTRNLNKVIDINHYPLPEAAKSNFRHRPIGIGVQGLADAFVKMRLPYDSAEARQLNEQIFETIYYGALEASCELAEKDGPYETFDKSPVSMGMLQFDYTITSEENSASRIWDWEKLRNRIAKHGLRNSLLVAPMPTATTAQILGNTESFEPLTSNLYVRRVLAGEYHVVNQHLVHDLIALDLWTPEIRNRIIANRGSIQEIEEIPAEIRELYKTVWEIPFMNLINMAAERGRYIDQSQSFNLYVAEPSYAKLTSIHFKIWQKGLKTGMYYLRTKAAANAIQFTVDRCSATDDQCISCTA